ncbi:MAG: valine--tRNA ligase [Lachnospiraceae bacterium]|jgi:valyl-tRNA synthetase|nr:valine--tRNA ligase [Lachnospiraceae bacterium]
MNEHKKSRFSDLPKTYDPNQIEDRQYQKWLDAGYFHAEPDPNKKPFTIVIPPPNITGQLHMGHALDNTMQDILVRMKRMQGYCTLWQPGTDHASIATEVKIIEKLKEEGIDKKDLGREQFLERAWQWKEEYGGRIVSQLKKLGSSCDWERERFTMDEGCNEAVTEVFVRMYQKGYIYKGSRIINWCPICNTSISDAEVEYSEQDGHFWHIRYPIAETMGEETEYITFATTRPETMLGDTAVAVHPEDERYLHLIGKHVRLPFVDRLIPIVGDTYVDREFGTGVVKITPGHDPNDFEVGKRHDLPIITIFNDDATINENGGEFQGMDRYAARKAIVARLDEMGLLVKVEEHSHNVGTHDRCKTIIEPIVKEQWFVKMDELIRPAIKAVQDGEIHLIPKRMEKIYFNWTDHIRDWCISRQLWWGHRIPAYTCDECHALYVDKEMPDVCPKCGSTRFTQDPDTLDTWFSSALWPFETLGWPHTTKDLEYFYPTDVLVTGYDIIFFWVIRMIFSGYEQMGEKPFHTVLFHGLIRDAQGRKMSKSLGNGIDPLEVIARYGADALRMTLVSGNAPGNDMRFSNEKVESSRNFANKVWNASRFILMNLEQYEVWQSQDRQTQETTTQSNHVPSKEKQENTVRLEATDMWIRSRLNTLIREVTDNLEKYELGIALQKLYDFVWDEFCDWYIEMVKPRLYATAIAGSDLDQSKRAALDTLRIVLRDILKLLPPFMPFLTEEIYCNLTQEESIMISPWPVFDPASCFDQEERAIEIIKEAVRGIRMIRTEREVPAKRKTNTYVVSEDPDIRHIFEEGKRIFASLAHAQEVFVLTPEQSREEYSAALTDAVSIVVPGADIYLPLAELVDLEMERERLTKEKKHLLSEIARCDALLSNEKFVAKAPESKLAEERQKAQDYRKMLDQVNSGLNRLDPANA